MYEAGQGLNYLVSSAASAVLYSSGESLCPWTITTILLVY